MSKANQKFVQADEAVSPVIGVILMVAITVVLAAVVFVLVSNLSKTSSKSEEAAVQVTSPAAGVISITLIKTGEHAPYDLRESCTASDADPNCADIAVNGIRCDFAAASGKSGQGTGADQFASGNTVRLTSGGADCTGSSVFSTGQANVQVTVTVANTVIYDSTIDVHQ